MLKVRVPKQKPTTKKNLQNKLGTSNFHLSRHKRVIRFEMSSNKRKQDVSIETKLEAIQRIDNGESIKKVAEDLRVGAVTTGD